MALTSAFVAAVRRQGSIASSFADADILLAGDAEIQGVFVPLLEQLRQNFFVREVTATVDARGRVPLPVRAIGAALRNVQLQLGQSWVSLPCRALEDDDSQSTGQPGGYYLDAGSIVLLPTGTSGTLRIRYTCRPGRMVLDTDAALSKAITVVGAPGAATTALTVAFTGALASCDIVSSGPAHQAKAIGATLSGTQPNLTVLNADLLEQPIAGDYVAIADTSPFVPLPHELYAALVHRTAGVILRSLAYDEEASMQLKVAEEVIASATPMLVPRNEGNPQRINGGIRRALNQRRRWL